MFTWHTLCLLTLVSIPSNSQTMTENPSSTLTANPSALTTSPTIFPSQTPTVFTPPCAYNATESTYICACHVSDQCKYQTLTCASDTDCRVECTATGACHTATIICPPNATCAVQCMDKTACYDATIQWPSSTTQTIACKGIQSCYGLNFPIQPPYQDFAFKCSSRIMCREADIYCPEHANCHIICSGDESCRRTNIVCPTDSNCTIECSGVRSCSNANIQWSSSPGLSTLICSGITYSCSGVTFPMPPPYQEYTFTCNKAGACESADIYCPTYADCHIICSVWESCKDTYIHWSTNNVYSTLTCDINACVGTNLPPTEFTRPPTMEPTGVPTFVTAIPTATSTIPTESPITSITPTESPMSISYTMVTDDHSTTSALHQDKVNNTMLIVVIIGAVSLSVCVIGCGVWMVVRTKRELDIASQPGHMGMFVAEQPPQRVSANKGRMEFGRVRSISSVSMEYVEGCKVSNVGEDDVEIPITEIVRNPSEGNVKDNNEPNQYNQPNDDNSKTNAKSNSEANTNTNPDGEPNNDDIITKDEETTGK